MIDAELMTRKCLLIMRDLEALRPLAARDRAAYLASTVDEAAAERYLERMIPDPYSIVRSALVKIVGVD